MQQGDSLSLISGGMPVPLSRTVISIASPLARRHLQGRLELRVVILALPLAGGIEAVAEQVEEDAGHLLRRDLDRREARLKTALQGDVEALFLRPGAVIGEVQSFVYQSVEVDGATLARNAARVLQHRFNNVVSNAEINSS